MIFCATLSSGERFDPREQTWATFGSMKTRRGCHSLVAYNEKLSVPFLLDASLGHVILSSNSFTMFHGPQIIVRWKVIFSMVILSLLVGFLFKVMGDTRNIWDG